MRTKTLTTSHADISVNETAGTGVPVVMIHGNSGSKEVFNDLMNGPLGEVHRMIAFDLPGHGASSDAHDPSRTYSMPGYAEMTMEVLDKLNVPQSVVFGWSLGGHIAMELLPRYSGMIGLMIEAAPPVHPTPESFQQGFRQHPVVPLIFQENLSDEEAELFIANIYGNAAKPAWRDALNRTDGRARRMLFETLFDGRTSDQQTLAETTKVPLAIVNGADDPIINTDFIGGLTYASLWEKHCFVLRGEGHAAFLTAPEVFNPIFERFVGDMAKQAQRRPKSTSKAEAAA
jgi:pimeloyl-ACP methyl ester carboxylesterase